MRSQRSALILVAIVAFGCLIRVWGLAWGLENANVSRRVHPDEWVVYWLFHWFGQTGTLNPCSQAQTRCFLDWGMAFPYAAYAVEGVVSGWLNVVSGLGFGPSADPEFARSVLDARLASAFFSTATIPTVYLLGKHAYGEAVGLTAAATVALSDLLIQLAHFGTPDSLTTLLLAGALLAIVRAAVSPAALRFGVAGALIGLAAASEYHMALLGLPLLAGWMLSDGRRRRFLGIASVSALMLFVAVNPYIIVDFPAFVDATLHTLRVRTVDSSAQYGDRWAPYGPSWLFEVRYAFGDGVGYPLTAVILAGVGWAFIRRRRTDVILLAWIVPYLVLISLSPAKFMRYGAPLLPPMAVLGARGVVDTWRLLGGRMRAGLTALAAAVVLYTAVYDAAYAGLFASTDPRAVAAQVIESGAPGGTQVAFDSLPDGLVNLPEFFDRSGLRLCYPSYNLNTLLGAPYIVFDQFTLDEQTATSRDALTRFRNQVGNGRTYRLVARIDHVPSFLGLDFPIEASPHDWRYPSHVISIFQRRVADPPHPFVCAAGR